MKTIICFFLLFAGICQAEDPYDNGESESSNSEDQREEREEKSPFKLPGERARPYDAELETPPTWPGKREDSFYDWLTH